MGICNGFQVLCEAHLLPGALTRNRSLSFICERVWLRVENASTPFTRAAKQGDLLRLPIKHGEGLYVAPEDEIRQMEERGQAILRYVDANGRESDAANPNGSMRAIAGVANERFNVFGLMPHPEHAVEAMLGGVHGLKIFQSIAGSARLASVPFLYRASRRSISSRPRARTRADEYRNIEQIIGRTPTYTELGVFSVMWSEHCSYKSSRRHLRKLPSKSELVVQGPGENAVQSTSVTDGRRSSKSKATTILRCRAVPGRGDGRGRNPARYFHDGRAAGGQHELAQLGLLPASPQRDPLGGVVGGIGGYGNCVGVPTVANRNEYTNINI